MGVYSAAVLADNPTAYWRLGDASGITAVDAAASPHNATYNGAPTLGSTGLLVGSADTAVVFNGSSQYAEAAYNAAFNPAVFSIEMLSKISGGAGSFRALFTSRDSPFIGYTLYASDSDLYELWCGDGSAWRKAISAVATTAGVRHHIVGTFDGTNGRIYIDGVQSGSTSPATVYVPNTSKPLRIGAGATEGAATFFFPGTLEEMAVYNSALSAAQVAAHYAAAQGLSPPPQRSIGARSSRFLRPPRKTILKLSAPTVVAPPPPPDEQQQTLRRKLAGRTRIEASRRAPRSHLAPPPKSVLTPSTEQQLRTISVHLSWRTRVDLRRRAAHPILWPPGVVQGSSLPVLRGITSSSVAGVGAPLVFPAAALVRAPPWRFAVTTLGSETLTFLDRIAYKKQVVFTLNKATSMSGTVDSDNPEIFIPHTDGDAFLSEGNRFLYCFRREGAQPTPWRIRAAGIILQINDIVEQDQPKSAFVAYDPWQYLYSRPCVKSDGSLPDESGLIFSGQRGDEIAHAIIKRTIDAHGSVFTDIGADGGTAFYGGTLQSTPQLDIQFVQGTTVGEALTQLAETAGIDIFFSPIYDPLNRPGYIAELNIYNQQGSIKRSAVMGWDKPGRNITTLDRMEDGTQRVNVAQYFRTNSIPVGAVQDVPSEAKFGEYWSTQSFPSDFPASYVEALAAEAVLVRKSHPTTVRVTPAPEMAPVPFAEYFIGDQLPVIASKRFRKPLSVLARVYSLPIDINDNCIEQVEALEFSSDALTPVTP